MGWDSSKPTKGDTTDGPALPSVLPAQPHRASLSQILGEAFLRKIIWVAVMLAGVGPAAAGVVTDRFENGGGCYIRQYDAAHLRAHPDQVVSQVNLELSPDQLEAGSTTLYFEFTLRQGSRYGADAYCTGDQCSLEGDGGSFTLAKQGKAIKLTVGDFLALEGEDFSPDLASSDDRVFLLNPC